VTIPAPLYPVALRLDGVPCLVVGGGRVAARKVEALLECGADVTVIAPEAIAELEQLPIRRIRRRYEPGDAARFRFVIAATGVVEVDRAAFLDSENAGVPVNAADDLEACRFLVPSVLRRGPVTVAVSTGGTSPFLAVWLRRRIAEVVGPEIAAVAALVGAVRRELKDAGHSTEAADWSSLINEDLVHVVAAGREDEARRRADNWLESELERLAGS